jgi:hypothetical protein
MYVSPCGVYAFTYICMYDVCIWCEYISIYVFMFVQVLVRYMHGELQNQT